MIPAARRRLVVLSVVGMVLLTSLGGRLWDLQVISGVSFSDAAFRDQTQTVVVPSVRGQILDDVGQPLVDNRTALVVSVNRALLMQQPDGGISELHRLASLLHMKYSLLQEKLRLCTAHVQQPCWQGSPYQPIPVDSQASDTVALQIMEEQSLYPGITAQPQPVVNYTQPYATDLAQTLGYLQPVTSAEMSQLHLPQTGFSGVDLVGQAGLEQQYDKELRGTPGRQLLSVNSAGEVIGVKHTYPAQAGDDLVTSINARLQADVSGILANAVHKAHVGHGAAVVMTTKGRIVAMASYPSYDPAVWNGGVSEKEYRYLFGTGHGEPILNQVTQGQYPPGSTWKVTTTAAAVQQGFSLYGSYDCPATISIDGQSFANDGEPNLGPMSFARALILSCDTVYYSLGYDMYLKDHRAINAVKSPDPPIQPMAKMEIAWGFGHYPGVDLPEQNAGSVPTRQWLYQLWKSNAYHNQDWCKNGRENGSYLQRIEWQNCQNGWEWEPGQAAIAAIGQGYVTVTPLQLADAYAALANGGTLYSPRIGEALVNPTTGKVVQKITPPVTRHLPVAKGTLAYIRNALRGVITQGTAASAFAGFPDSKVCVAGKTGTANTSPGTQPNSVFASFAPCSHPKYVVVMMVPGAGFGAQVSAPAVRQIWDALYGLEKHQAAVPNGQVPSSLPTITPAGAIKPPKG